MKKKVAIIGGGNWGTTIAKMIAANVSKTSIFDDVVHMWVYPEKHNDKDLIEIINTKHTNPKYLPSILLPDNLIGTGNIDDLCDSDILVFIVPHQFVSFVKVLKGKIKKDCIGVSLIKGFIYEDGEIIPVSSYIKEALNINISVIMGANIALQVAENNISEATLGYTDEKAANVLYRLFNCFTFRITKVNDIFGVELSGTLKNIVALAYGLAEGLGHATNTKAAIFRTGLVEIKKFYEFYFPMAQSQTLFESSGVGDLLVSCLCGRNYKYGIQKARENVSIEKFEEEMGGQKLQGPSTAKDVYNYLSRTGRVEEFPLMVKVYKICYRNEPADSLVMVISSDSLKCL